MQAIFFLYYWVRDKENELQADALKLRDSNPADPLFAVVLVFWGFLGGVAVV